MKKIFLTTVIILHFLFSFSTPEKASWISIDFIGANDNYYYYYLNEREYPGIYDSYIDKYSIIKCSINTDSIIEKIILRKTEFRFDSDNSNKKTIIKKALY